MSNQYAMIADGIVINVCLWDGIEYSEQTKTGWSPPEGITMIFLTQELLNEGVGIGHLYDGNVFSAPPPPPSEEELSEE